MCLLDAVSTNVMLIDAVYSALGPVGRLDDEISLTRPSSGAFGWVGAVHTGGADQRDAQGTEVRR